MIEVLAICAGMFATVAVLRYIIKIRNEAKIEREINEYISTLRNYSNGGHISLEEWKQAAELSLAASVYRREKKGGKKSG